MASFFNNVRQLALQSFGLGGGLSTKHDYYTDYGWPRQVTFEQFKQLYERNGIAASAVNKTVAKTWESHPVLWEVEGRTEETPVEREIRLRFKRLRIWQSFMEVDRRSIVGKFSAAIILLGDGKELNQPVDSVPGRLEGLSGLTPVWEGQLTVQAWNTDQTSPDYGKPLMYQYSSDNVGVEGLNQVNVHPDRILIWSDNGTMNGNSGLKAGFNDVVDAEKIKGAGGEGFWKSARGAPMIEAPQGMSMQDLQKAMNAVSSEEVMEKLNERLDDFQSGFDKAFMLGGMTAKPLQITLPQPKQFFDIAINGFAASFNIPIRVLIGNETGERASTEDAREWAQVNMSRRENRIIPLIDQFVGRLVDWGILPDADWIVGWDSLLDATPDQLLDRAAKMQTINKDGGAERPFTPDEIREVAGYTPLTDSDYNRDESEEEELPE